VGDWSSDLHGQMLRAAVGLAPLVVSSEWNEIVPLRVLDRE